MKYILITLLSFTFATEITTREFEIEIPLDSDGYQFYANIDLLDYIGIDYAQITPIEISGFSSNIGGYYLGMQIADRLGCHYQGEYVECEINSFGVISQGNSNLDIWGQLYNEGSVVESITFKFWAKGIFEDEDTSMGDMNNDGSLNIYDILELVNIILDGDSGDIFDVMEIIKRV